MKNFMLRMRARRAKMKGGREYKQAAFMYMGLKTSLLLLTYYFMTCKSCDTSNITRPLIHMILGAHFIYAGMRITTSVLAIISFFRATAYLVNFFFKKSFLLALPLTGKHLTVLTERGAGNWIFLLKALALYVIFFMIFRAFRARFMKPDTVSISAATAS